MDLKAKLSGATWQLHVERTINIEGEEAPVVIRRPPKHVLVSLLDTAKKAGEVDADYKPVSDYTSLRVLARLTALTLFAPGAVRSLYTQEEIDTVLNAPWLLELQEDVMGAVSHITALVEAAKGN
jgi:hypothetical protein